MAKNKRNWAEINARKGKRYMGDQSPEENRKPHRQKAAPKKGLREASKQSKQVAKYEDEIELSPNMIIGRNPVMEALKSGREIEKILVNSSAEGSIAKIIGIARDRGIPIYQGDRANFDRLVGNRPHQGVIAYASAHEYAQMEDIYAKAAERNEDPLVIILDNLEDPHNLGAIMRTAECAGAHGIIIPKRRSCGLTETVAKASAGAIEYMPCVKVSNIAQTIEQLKEDGFWICACDMGDTMYYQQDLRGKLAIVIGSEGNGISQLVKKKCDFTVSMPMVGNITSLNASNAAAILMYEVRRQRDGK